MSGERDKKPVDSPSKKLLESSLKISLGSMKLNQLMILK